MTMDTLSSPFGTEVIADVPLERSPLARALVQVRFPQLVAMSEANIDATINATINALGGDFPILKKEKEVQFSIGPDGPSQIEGARLWRLRSADEKWQVSLGETFIALEAAKYSSRTDFIDQLSRILEPIKEVINPPFAERIGVRYTNIIDSPSDLLHINKLVRPEVLGGFAVPRPEGVALAHMMSQSLYKVHDRMLNVRWGYLPPGAQFDPQLAASDRVSWMLDLDSFTQTRIPFEVQHISSMSNELAHGAYRYFRWVVTKEFLTTFGGSV